MYHGTSMIFIRFCKCSKKMNKIGLMLIELCMFSSQTHEGKKKKHAVSHWMIHFSCVSCECKNKKHEICIFCIMSWEWNISITRKYSLEHTTFLNLENTRLKSCIFYFCINLGILMHLETFGHVPLFCRLFCDSEYANTGRICCSENTIVGTGLKYVTNNKYACNKPTLTLTLIHTLTLKTLHP